MQAKDEEDTMDLSKMNFDNEVLAYLSNRKDQLIEAHEEYIINHAEIREVLNDFLSSVLLNKPVSIRSSCRHPTIFPQRQTISNRFLLIIDYELTF